MAKQALNIDGPLLLLVLAVMVTVAIVLTITRPRWPDAPGGAGICWIQDERGDFEILEREIRNPATCGSRLEGVYLKEGREVAGAYNGFFLTVDSKGIWGNFTMSGMTLLILPGDRKRIDNIILGGANADIDAP